MSVQCVLAALELILFIFICFCSTRLFVRRIRLFKELCLQGYLAATWLLGYLAAFGWLYIYIWLYITKFADHWGHCVLLNF